MAKNINAARNGLFDALSQQKILFLLFSGMIFGSILLSFAFESLYLLGLPVIAIFGYLALLDLKVIYWILWASIPLSTEFFLPGGLGTDLPSEPLAVFLILAAFIWMIPRITTLNFTNLLHPVTILLLLHFGWICLTALQSENILVSFKFAMAKSWYIAAYFFLAFLFVRSDKDIRKWLLVVLIPLVFSIIWVMARHSGQGFTFASINSVLSPFYRNHVTYASTIVIFIPFLWYLARTAQNPAGRRIWFTLIGFLVIGTYFSYTRAAYATLPLMVIYSFVVRWKMTKWVIGGSLVAAGIFLGVMAHQNKYLEFAPDYDRTITHYQFDKLLSATYKMEDISTMERFYRWIAGMYMLNEAPVAGFGPGNFYNYYHSFTDRNFETYVSDNPDKSGTHNYYLMVAVDQGITGLVIFIILVSAMLLTGEKLYHRARNRTEKRFVMAILLSLVSILFIQLLNDMIETDKIGALFFFIAAMLVAIELRWINFQPGEGEKTRLSESRAN